MARIYDTENNPLDYCRACFPKTEESAAISLGESVDSICHNADHPPYSDTDYRCEKCDRPLADRDNGGPHN